MRRLLLEEAIAFRFIGILHLHAITIIVVALRLSEHLLHVVAACGINALVVEVDKVWVPVCGVLAGEEGCVGGHDNHVAIALHMKEIESLSESIDEFLIF